MIVKMYRPSYNQLMAFRARESFEIDHEKTLEGPVYMVDVNHKPMFCYSVTIHTTCMEAHFMVTQEGAKEYPRTLQKTTKQMIVNAFEVCDIYNKMVLDVLPEDEKWARSLGFKKSPNCDNLKSIEGYSNFVLNREDL